MKKLLQLIGIENDKKTAYDQMADFFLYIVTDAPIPPNDWYIHEGVLYKNIPTIHTKDTDLRRVYRGAKLVVASDNPLLHTLPRIPKSLWDAYLNNKELAQVEVEYWPQQWTTKKKFIQQIKLTSGGEIIWSLPERPPVDIDALIQKVLTRFKNVPFIEFYTHLNAECYKIWDNYSKYRETKIVLCKVSDGFVTALKKAIEWDQQNPVNK